MKVRKVRTDETGFTLPEILVVLILLAVLAAVAISTTSKFSSSLKKQNSLRTLYHAVEEARLRAFVTKHECCVTVASDTVVVSCDVDGDGVCEKVYSTAGLETVLDTSSSEVKFDTTGCATSDFSAVTDEEALNVSGCTVEVVNTSS